MSPLWREGAVLVRVRRPCRREETHAGVIAEGARVSTAAFGPTRTGIKALHDEITEIEATLPSVEAKLARATASVGRARDRAWDVGRERDALVEQRDAARAALLALRATLPRGAADGIGGVVE
jgi:hypothetical protein